MKVQLLSTELIKPSTSTPQSLRDYKISIVDELCPVMNVPTILYYPTHIHTSGKEYGSSISKCMHLKKSLSKVLTRFYPFAGRYMKDAYLVDCSDQGAEFVEAKVDIRLDDLIGQGKNLKVELLNSLLPRPIGAGDQVTDPLLAVQLSVFACGGYAIGVLSSHRIADISTTSTLIKEWATDARLLLGGFDENDNVAVFPIWNTASMFPGQKMSGLPLGLTREKENVANPKFVTKKFYFSKSAIAKIREKARLDNSSERLPTRVQSLWGIIGKAIVDINVANPETPRGFLIISGSEHEGKNRSTHSEKSMWKSLLNIHSSIRGRRKRGGTSRPGRSFNALDPEISSVSMFSDWCKSPFYEADFGWGKPDWVSSVSVPMRNNVYLLSDKSGEGIEAWVNLNIDDMPKFEQDSNIMELTS
ncbi:hypothetical protein POM88_022470 [Heracleum sosnowskyi]|uniref:Acyltransferase n=1 Tax=Heracleum sosnowskyi TaxID=360622 RepID=A0AAD8MPN9_9APIA|nr:hypothetical protein POM88_022470 [Heracleum sosnowskyi]